MKKLTIIIGLLFCSLTSAEWVYFFESSVGDQFWFDNERTRIKGDDVFVWARKKFKEESKFGDSSTENYLKINCRKFTFQTLENIWYTDNNWTYFSSRDKKGSKEYIAPNSSIKKLANIICNDVV